MWQGKQVISVTLIGSRSSGFTPAVTGRSAFFVAANTAAPLSGVTCALLAFRSANGRSFLLMSTDIPLVPFDWAFAAVAEARPPLADAVRVDRVVRMGTFSVTATEALEVSLLRVDARVGAGLLGAPLDFAGMQGERIQTRCCV